jgi:hypothetical protein
MEIYNITRPDPNIRDPWAFLGAFDIIPIGALDALAQDRQVIRRYKELSGRKDACQ